MSESTLIAALNLLADIRSAIGDPDGRLMQDELVERCRDLAEKERTCSCRETRVDLN